MNVRNVTLSACALVGASLLFCGCAAPSALVHPPPTTEWRVGPFVVRRVSLPASVLDNANDRFLGSDTVLRVGTTSPYVVSRRSLDSRHWSTVAALRCSQQPIWQGGEGPRAILLCVGPTGTPTRLVLVGDRGGAAIYDLPVHLAHIYGGSVVTTEAGSQLFWEAIGTSPFSAPAGTGTINLRTGARSTATLPSFGPVILSPDDTLYAFKTSLKQGSSAGEYRLTGSQGRWEFVGNLPDQRIVAVGNDGTAWAFTPNEADINLGDFVRETPGSHRVSTWTIHGYAIGYGPGYIAYMPLGADGTSGSSLDLFFPMQHRTLRFQGLYFSGAPTGPAPAYLDQTSPSTGLLHLQRGDKSENLVITQ